MKRMQWLITILMLLSMVLSACGGGTTTVEEPVVVENNTTTNNIEEPVEPEVDEPEGFDFSALNAAYDIFLADMEVYNTTGLDALNVALAEEPPFLLDVRSPEEVEKSGHIEGSVLIPLRDLADNLAYLPSFDTPIVSYCGSGWRCTIALTALEAMGWEDVKGLKGNSFSGWMEAEYAYVEGLEPEAAMLNAVEVDPALVAHFDEVLTNIPEGWGVMTAENLNLALVEQPDLIVIDTRTAGETVETGIVDAPNWINIPLEEIVAGLDLLPEDKDTPIVIHCKSGHRSTIAMTILWSYGYTNVSSLKGGFIAWEAEGYPIIGGEPDLDTAFETFLVDMVAYNTIGLDGLNTALAEEPPFLLDVRSPEEAEGSGHIEGSVLIPLRDLADNLAYLPSFDTPIVSYCGSGWRCTIALTALEAMGWEDVKGLKGDSFSGWVEAEYAYVEGLEPEAAMLNAVEVDPALVAHFDEVLTNIPEGWGVMTAENLTLAMVENPDLIVIDTRTSGEAVETGIVDSPNWINIPLEELVAGLDQLPEDKETPIVIHCKSGHRSTIAMTILWSYGYTNVSSLKGGFIGWEADGYPVIGYVAP